MRQHDAGDLATAPAALPLLGPGDPPPYTVVNGGGTARALLLADHAGRAVPRALGQLGLDDPAVSHLKRDAPGPDDSGPGRVPLDRHIAYDIGIAWLTRRLAALLDAPALVHNYSRLLIDPNRPLDDPTSICVISDGVVVPANRGLTPDQRRARAAALFRPYHDAIDARIQASQARGMAPAILSLHSFTPSMRGRLRPWHIGVLWADDGRIPIPLMTALARQGVCVGDNQPYSGRSRHGYTIETHALPRGLPNALLEVRQDLIETPEAADAWAERLAGPLADILCDEALYQEAQG